MGAGINQGTGQGQQVYYDPQRGQYYTVGSSNYNNPLAWSYAQPQRNYIGGNPSSGKGGSMDGNEAGLIANQNRGPKPYTIQNYMPAGLTAYGANAVAPAARPAPVMRPQPNFDMSFLSQLANRGAQQAATQPARPTLTPGAAQTYGGYQGMGGLAGLNAIANTGGSNA